MLPNRKTKPWVWKKPFNPESLESFPEAIYLNSNHETDKNFLALGVAKKTEGATFEALENLLVTKDWCFGYFAYDCKNQLENLESHNTTLFNIPDLHFFVPEVVIEWSDKKGHIHFLNDLDLSALHETLTIGPLSSREKKVVSFKPLIDKPTFLEHILSLKDEIQYGNIYEVNYCQAFTAQAEIHPYRAYAELNSISPVPFSAFVKLESFYAMCASPERYVKKEGERIISQPIKGTISRGKTDEEDNRLKEELFRSEKDRSENVMIVDLVRNDLSKTAQKGSVKVEELFGIYPFPQVHQMISTVTSKLRSKYSPLDVVKNSFPMGSMTGAPKIKAMELIEKYEVFKRGLYAGSIGYFSPEGDFDFNVVIRSLFYNKENQKLGFAVGGAITIESDPNKEYEETLLKAKAIFQLFANS
jgi:para-aminobenzoate synthetase component 1